MAAGAQELPIFELPVVLLPGELLPLHIFEERYKRMIGHCLDAEEPFGIVFRDDDGSARRIGCEARVTEIIEQFDDGRMNILVSGERPFKVLDRFEGEEYPAGEVEPIDGDPADDDPELTSEDVDSPGEVARAAFADLVGRISGEPPDAEELATESSYDLAARVELPAETKQRLLELRSEPDRMQILGNAFRALITAVERSQAIAERARVNGKVIVGPIEDESD